ncbi:hypothetical protein BDV98DRAFT_574396 [Pterulicium gracile]|uniref:Uncharacterized protein n=1 Tax=Pterulicium gracile TaxID=1884261 RepID=A0A5C3Q5L3_9AGAR|nr:hypothetical protein BDV98DRAFT_574396 [Pterula gracilis]
MRVVGMGWISSWGCELEFALDRWGAAGLHRASGRRVYALVSSAYMLPVISLLRSAVYLLRMR